MIVNSFSSLVKVNFRTLSDKSYFESNKKARCVAPGFFYLGDNLTLVIPRG